MPDVVAVVADLQHGAEHLRGLRLDQQHQAREDFAKRRVSRNHLLDPTLRRKELFVILLGSADSREFLSLRKFRLFGLLRIGHLRFLLSVPGILRLVGSERHIKTQNLAAD
jgi:hypothetical protein